MEIAAPLFLALLASSYLFTVFGNLSLGNFIISQGKTTFYLYLFLLQAAIGFPMGYILIMQFGVLGLIVTSLLTQIPLIIIMLYWIRKRYELTVDWHSSAKILLSSSLTAVLTYILISEVGMSSLVRANSGSSIFPICVCRINFNNQDNKSIRHTKHTWNGKRNRINWQNTKPIARRCRKVNARPKT